MTEAPWNREVRGTQIVELINGDHKVLRVPAGPGTGKTFGLRRRVLRILHPEGLAIDPSRVLVSTFNRVIAEDLQREISQELSEFGLEIPRISTVHGLSLELLGHDTRYLLPEEVTEMLYDIRLANPPIDARYEHKQGLIEKALRDHEAGLASEPALATAVNIWLTDHGASLIGDTPRIAEARLRGGAFGEHRYDHILVDEFQDLTDVEINLLLGLRSDDAQLVVLGDRKQSIYAFRGNHPDSLNSLDLVLPDSIFDHRMDECQRCPTSIVSLANDVAAVFDEPLTPITDSPGSIHVLHHDSPSDEQERLAFEIVRTFKAAPTRKHLVLATRRQWGSDMKRAINSIDSGLDVQTVFGEDALETLPARNAFIFFCIFGNPDDGATCRDWISYQEPNSDGKKWKGAGRHSAVYRNIFEAGGTLNVESMRQIVASGKTVLHGAGRKEVFKRVTLLVEMIDLIPRDNTLEQNVDWIFDPERWNASESQFPQLAIDDIERMRLEAHKIIDEHENIGIRELVNSLRTRIAKREPLGIDGQPDIKIVTLWGAKGLTADFVYVFGLCDEVLPGTYDEERTSLSESEYNLEQLRLLYVSITRAKSDLVISRPQLISRGEVASLNIRYSAAGTRWDQETLPCRFFDNIAREHFPASIYGRAWPGINVT
jgi:superfamily I DNA/RNA helicase